MLSLCPFILALSLFGQDDAALKAAGVDPKHTALHDYVAKPEPDYKFEILGTIQTSDGIIKQCKLTSQRWQNIVWTHAVYLYEPRAMAHPKHAAIFVTGGRTGGVARMEELAVGMNIAKTAGMRVATLHHVPNQPLLGDHVEDDLITETFLKFLDTKDPTWPLLFPMAKSAVKAMDAVQEESAKGGNKVEHFFVTGGSKRGWTTWLSAVVDKRVQAIAPMVIDTLNFRPQMRHQMASWGFYSEQIDDYSKKGLIDLMEKKPEVPLWLWCDPYTYRKALTLPKLIVNGANDPYWTVDALNQYWNDLEGPKYIHYVPNGGHGLDGGRETALSTVALFFRHNAAGEAFPKLNWTYAETDNGTTLTVTSDKPAKSATAFVVRSKTKDFRKSKWLPTAMNANGNTYTFDLPKLSPGEDHRAVLASLSFVWNKIPFALTTQIKVD